ncbi:heterochromatin protein one [Ophiostoma piceae UAMH 11346]|uniref:Heterochromatin protein one n=1 Tax=Ophiostoma piceae (strain UAMH 11346) TaxID=1262450 RepID=S3CQS0_OPHP1|nr:heterochromatin protein one [Ophiostoma piceae UAMH 11346]
MPPALSDDEMSDASGVGAVTTPPASKRGKKVSSYADAGSDSDDASDHDAPAAARSKSASRTNGKKKEEPAPIKDEDEDEGGDEDGDEEDEEYEVQEIVGHMLDPRFRVIWKGYTDPADHTWEPEDNLMENASIILNDYYLKIGGREAIFQKATKGKKRGRPPASASASTTPTPSAAKRSRKAVKVEDHPASRESSPDVDKPFKPPAGSWEADVMDVEMFRGDDGELRVFLTWKDGNKSQHVAQQAYVRCPQRILRFYESRISFKSPSE